MTRILFICKHNRFRSKVAEAIFKNLNKNPSIKSDSAGIILDESRPYIAESVINIMSERGYLISGIPKRVSKNEIDSYDLIIIVAHKVDKDFFVSNGFKGRIAVWKVHDADEEDIAGINKIIRNIERRVKSLLKNLNGPGENRTHAS